jgi:hypothetical protein
VEEAVVGVEERNQNEKEMEPAVKKTEEEDAGEGEEEEAKDWDECVEVGGARRQDSADDQRRHQEDLCETPDEAANQSARHKQSAVSPIHQQEQHQLHLHQNWSPNTLSVSSRHTIQTPSRPQQGPPDPAPLHR